MSDETIDEQVLAVVPGGVGGAPGRGMAPEGTYPLRVRLLVLALAVAASWAAPLAALRYLS